MIEININLVFTIINLIVLYLLMKKFLFGPVIGIMEQRKSLIDQQFASARETEQKALELKDQYEDSLKSAREESFRIMDQAKEEAKSQAGRIMDNANAQAEEIIAKARENIRLEQETAMKDMEGKVAELAMEAAARIMGEKSSNSQDLSLYDQFLEEAGDFHDRNIH